MKNLVIALLFFSLSDVGSSQSFFSDGLSPLTTKSKYILLVGGAASLIIAFDKHGLDEQANYRATVLRPFKDAGQIGEEIGWGYLNALYALGNILHYGFTGDGVSAKRSYIMTSSSLWTLATTVSLKQLVGRSRPLFPEEKDSFPSGHSSMAFNFASVVTAEHGFLWGLPAYTAATFIAYSRMNDGRHWLSDVVAGATIGGSFGWGVYLNQSRSRSSDSTLQLAPLSDGLVVQWNKRF
jgi:membrane-associated phospholipid phosphatase